MALTKQVYEHYWEQRKGLSLIEEKIFERITEVLKVYEKVFGAELTTWYFEGAREGQVGTFSRPYDDCINLECIWNKEPKDKIKLELFADHYGCNVNVSYLFMEDDAIAEEIKGEIASSKEYEKLQKEKAAAKKTKKQTEKEKILKKLTAKDRKTLGL